MCEIARSLRRGHAVAAWWLDGVWREAARSNPGMYHKNGGSHLALGPQHHRPTSLSSFIIAALPVVQDGRRYILSVLGPNRERRTAWKRTRQPKVGLLRLPPSELARLAGAVIEVWSNIPAYGKGMGEWGTTPLEEPDEAPGATRLSGFDCVGESPSSQGEESLRCLFATLTVPARPANYSFTYRIRYPDYYQWLGQSWNNGTLVIPATPVFVRTHEPTGIAGMLSQDVTWKGWAWRDDISYVICRQCDEFSTKFL